MLDAFTDDIDNEPRMPLSLRQPRIYRPALLFRVIWAIFFGVSIGLLMGGFFRNCLDLLVGHPGVRFSDLVEALVGLVVIVFLYGSVNSACVTLSERGMAYSELAYSVSCTWGDLKSAARVWTNIGFNYDLVIQHSNLRTTKWLRWLIQAIGLDQRIPLSRLLYDWRVSEIGDYMHYYAPHIHLPID